jgi:RND family efflux transporter MFP subunit
LRKATRPWLAKQRAVLKSAKAQLDQAKLNLERATVVAPFDAVILSESLELGSQVAAGSEVAMIVATEAFLVEVNIPAERTATLDFGGTPATIRLSEGTETQPRQGELLRLAGEVDAAGRMVRAQVALLNPMEGKAPLLLGSYVRVDVPLLASPDTLSIPRGALREGDIVWLAKDGKELSFQAVTVGLRRDHDVLISAGLEPGQRVITSPIAVPVPGTALRVIESETQAVEAGHGMAAGGLDQ